MAQYYATDFHAQPPVPSKSKREPQFEVAWDSREEDAQPVRMIFTPPAPGGRTRKPETKQRLRKSWICEKHRHPRARHV